MCKLSAILHPKSIAGHRQRRPRLLVVASYACENILPWFVNPRRDACIVRVVEREEALSRAERAPVEASERGFVVISGTTIPVKQPAESMRWIRSKGSGSSRTK